MVIAGGNAGGWTNAVEVYYPATGQSCSPPNLLYSTYGPTLDYIQGSLYSCGGDGHRNLCHVLRLGAGEWVQYVTLSQSRLYHISWVPSNRPQEVCNPTLTVTIQYEKQLDHFNSSILYAHQIFLLGGLDSNSTAHVEVVNTDTDSVRELPNTLSPGRMSSCGISLGDTLVIVAGSLSRNSVLR